MNVHDLFVIGKETLAKMKEQSVFSFSYRRNMKANTLASASTTRTAENGTLDSAVRYTRLCKKVSAAKSLVTPERLPPTSSATKYHSLRSYRQIMQWMGQGEDIDLSKGEMESTNQQTSSSDDGHCTRTTNTPENASLQLFQCLQHTPLHLPKA